MQPKLAQEINRDNMAQKVFTTFKSKLDELLEDINARPLDEAVVNLQIGEEIEKEFKNTTKDLPLDVHNALNNAAQRISVVLLRNVLAEFNKRMKTEDETSLVVKKSQIAACVKDILGDQSELAFRRILEEEEEENPIDFPLKFAEKMRKAILDVGEVKIQSILDKSFFGQ